MKNTLLRREVEQQNAERERQEQTRNLLAEYTMPGSTPEQRAANLNRLMAVNPDAAFEAQRFQGQQDARAREMETARRAVEREQAQTTVRRMQRILASPNPAVSLRVNNAFPAGGLVERLHEMGIIDTTDGIDDDEARRIAQITIDHVAPLAALDMPEPDAFTLSPGEVRFVGGQEVASVPASAGGTSGFTLSPGQTRFDPSGRQVASLPGGTETDQRARKIADVEAQLLRSNMDPQAAHDTAVNVVDGNLEMEVVPQTGSVLLIDTVSQTAVEVPLGGNARPVPAPPAGETLYDQAELGTGPVSAAAAGISRVTGMAGGPVAEETIEARQTLQTATGEMIRALAVNPRFPVAEMERLRQEISLSPQIFDNTATMRARMEAIDQSLRTRLAQADRDANDTSLPRDVRQAQASNASAIRNFLAVLGVPNGADAAQGATGDGPESLPGFAQLTPAEQAELRRLYRAR